MDHHPTESPFMARKPVRLGFGIVFLMLLTVVSAGVALLIYCAMQVPAITSEVNAWMGRPIVAADSGEARKMQVIFALFVYTAPLALGILVGGLHVVINWLDRMTKQTDSPADDEFRMG